MHPEALWHINADQKLLCDANCTKRQLVSQPHRTHRAAAGIMMLHLVPFRRNAGLERSSGSILTLHSHQEGSNHIMRMCLKYPSRKMQLPNFTQSHKAQQPVGLSLADNETISTEGYRRTRGMQNNYSHERRYLQYKFEGVL